MPFAYRYILGKAFFILVTLTFTLNVIPEFSFAEDTKVNLPNFLTPKEKQWLSEHPSINLAPDPEFLPIEYIDNQGNYKGIAADYIHLLEKKLNVKFNILELENWSEVLEKTKNKENDMWGAATPTPQRAEYMLFTKSFIELPAVILVRKSVDKTLNNIEALKGMRVAVLSGYGVHDYLSNKHTDLELDPVPDIQTGLKKVSFGLVDALIANVALATYYIEEGGITNLRIGGKSGFIYKWGIASRKDWPELNSILEKGLAQISPQERKQIYRKWAGVKLEGLVSLKKTLIIFTGILVLFGIGTILVWNKTLMNKVKIRTAQLAEARNIAEEANAAKSIFLANMSHEIRTPMNAVLGYAQILERADELTKESKAFVKNILNSGNHLLHLIDEILDLSKIEAGKMELNLSDFDLNDLVREMSNMFKFRCEAKNLKWINEGFGSQPIWVIGDETKLRQVLINLLGNAVKFTDFGEIKLRMIPEPNDNYRFEVIDSGKGISKEAQTNLFETFMQGREGIQKGGTGLGLAISLKQVELMGGKLTLESELEKGSKFLFTLKLPLAVEQSGTKDKLSFENVKKVKSDREVAALVVDDNLENRDVLKNFLTSINIKVDVADNGDEAIKKAKDRVFDIVFMDFQMPGLNGAETIEIIKKDSSSASTKTVIITASVFEEKGNKIEDYNCDKFLLKPFKTEQIFQCLTELLDIEFETNSLPAEKLSAQHPPPLDLSKITIKKALLSRLITGAQNYNITELSKALKELSESGENGMALANHLETFSRKYDYQKVLTILNQVQYTNGADSPSKE